MTIKAWTPAELRLLRDRATHWFKVSGRDLPWRRTLDPYAIWISEIMLQQTQVATVIPYFDRFLLSFPNVRSLASTSLDHVFQHWAGLGYYRRARQLHSAAQRIVSDFGGIFPTTYDEVLSLPGIGRYTAGAILSFAKDQRLPIVEANTQRLYARLLHLDSDLASTDAQAALWQFAHDVLPSKRGSGRVNQALMEIGSQICTPKAPACLLCPLQPWCPTFEHGTQAKIPRAKPKKIYTELREGVLIIMDPKRRLLMRRNTEQERWSGLWDFPRFDITDCMSERLERSQLSLLFESLYGCPVQIGNAIHQMKHGVTRYRITLRCFEASLAVTKHRSQFGLLETRWGTAEQIDSLALCASAQKLWTWLKDQRQARN